MNFFIFFIAFITAFFKPVYVSLSISYPGITNVKRVKTFLCFDMKCVNNVI